jgi:hypothetical protein
MDTRGGAAVASEPTEEEQRIAAEQERDGGGDPGDRDFHENLEAERRTLADLAADEPEPEPEAEQYTLFGTAPKVNSQIKGAGRVAQSMVKIRSLQQPLPAQRDKDGQNTGSKRVHHTTMIALDQVGDVDEAFAEVDGRDRDAELEALRARVAELEGQLATA